MITTAGLRSDIGLLVHAVNRRLRVTSDRGEGVISTAIAVLIVAFLGAAMWVAFDRIWTGTEVQIEAEVSRIGGGAP